MVAFMEQVLRTVLGAPLNPMTPAQKRLRTRIEQDLVEFAEAFIAVFADRVLQKLKISEVAEAPRKIMFLVEQRSTRAEALWAGVNASLTLNCFVHETLNYRSSQSAKWRQVIRTKEI